MAFWVVEALGQQSVDVGFLGGAGTYFGDMSKVDFQKSVNTALGTFIRFNFNPRYTLRLNLMNGKIGADGDVGNITYKFGKNVIDVSILFEFNYLKYIIGDKETRWSTYLLGGVGMQTYDYTMDAVKLAQIVDPKYLDILKNNDPSGRVITPTIPFGVGVKYSLNKRWEIGFEGSLRKSFSDKLDDLDDPLSYVDNNGVLIKYADQMHNNDWTAYFCVSLVYKLVSGNQNWEVKTKRKHILDWGIINRNRK